MNLGQLTNRVMDATLRGGALAGGNREQVQEDINEAIKTVDSMLRPLVITTTEVLTSGQADYSLLADFVLTDLSSIRSVSYTSTAPAVVRELRELSAADIRRLRETTPQGTAVYAYAIDGLDTLMLFPNTTQAGATITITYSERPLDLIAETDVPVGLPAEWHELYEVAAIQRSMRQTSPEYAAQYTQMFEHKVDEFRKWRNRRSGARGRVAIVGPGRRIIVHDPSADWR